MVRVKDGLRQGHMYRMIVNQQENEHDEVDEVDDMKEEAPEYYFVFVL